MTGYGKAEVQTELIKVKVELKSLNGKFIEINLRTPRQLSEKEIYLRNYFTKNIVRGTVLAMINIERVVSSSDQLSINQDLAIQYYNAFKNIADKTGANPDHILSSVFNVQEVMSSKEDTLTDEEWESVKEACDLAVVDLEHFRKNEGETLREIMKTHCQKLIALIPQVEEHEATRKERMIQKLKNALAEKQLAENYDTNRMEQELIYYLEKLDLAEEKNRLIEHCNLFMNEINGDVSGKKLGFITQEMGREINTLGSKANYAPIQKIVVEMKEELEKIKEQTFNIL